MSTFSAGTIDELRGSLNTWRERLDEAEADLRFRKEQADKALGIAITARGRVADYERLLAVAEGRPAFAPEKPDGSQPADPNAPADAYAEYSTAQLDGNACISCDGDLTGISDGVSHSSRPVAMGPRGQLFMHSDAALCMERGVR